tara:strand:- start:85 stop:387 length:303 start_codon:yes stop_codon:yes gene_type:complete
MERNFFPHPLALLHTITVDTYYRNIYNYFIVWKDKFETEKALKSSLKLWTTIYRAKKYTRANLLEFRQVIDNALDNDDLVDVESVVWCKKILLGAIKTRK